MPVRRPDFGHVTDSWIFDLDNTLYRAGSGIFAQIEGAHDRLCHGLPQAAARRGAARCRKISIAAMAPP